jgi:hypothetical protein
MKATPLLVIACAFVALVYPASPARAQVVLTGSSYSQDFNSIGTGLPDGWTIRTGADGDSQGTAQTFTTTAVSWANTSGAFKNLASAALGSGADATAQGTSTNRALGIRQTDSIGDPGASFQFNFNSTGLTVTQLSIDVQMLSVQTRSSVWSLQWSDDSGSTWATLGTWADPGTFGITAKTFTGPDVSGLSDLSSGLFRVATFTASTGSGSRDTIAIDNFTLSFIPEPSIYAALLGLATLGIVVVRRRKALQAV